MNFQTVLESHNLKTYYIARNLLPQHFKKHRYMKEGNRYDYLGQILLQQGFDIPDKTRFPSDLKVLIPGLTFNCRGVIHNTTTTMNILALDLLDKSTHPQKLEELLTPIGIHLEWVNKI